MICLFIAKISMKYIMQNYTDCLFFLLYVKNSRFFLKAIQAKVTLIQSNHAKNVTCTHYQCWEGISREFNMLMNIHLQHIYRRWWRLKPEKKITYEGQWAIVALLYIYFFFYKRDEHVYDFCVMVLYDTDKILNYSSKMRINKNIDFIYWKSYK